MNGATLALLFTDIEGSTRMLERLGERFADVIREHHRVMRTAIQVAGGREISTAGDSFFAVFERAAGAVECAEHAQREFAAVEWPGGETPRVRMGIHAGLASISSGEFVGIDVHRAARVMSVAYGGQVLLTDAVVGLLGSGVPVRDLGYHRLKDLSAPEHLFQLIAPGLDAEFPALRSLNRSNLPTPAHPLVGRKHEIARALELLSRDEVRLLTLLGPGGAGKTRLSIELAADSIGRYRDGVWIVPLAPIPDQELMVSELARVLEVNPVAGESLQQTLIARMAEREILLVLDNFEHLLDAANVVASLIAAAPRLDVLATSREPLRIRGEHRMEIGPMPVGDASELFLQRAAAVRPELSSDAEDRAAVERICLRLDGLPLALEMAAPRIAIFSPRVLETRLAERLALPEGPRDLPERQRTLRATIDWSYQLLDEPEQALFASLAPFIGGVRIDSAEAIWGQASIEGLISLAEKSLLGRRDDQDREPRFWMLETVREFAIERAGVDGGFDRAAGLHAVHYYELAEQAAPQLHGAEQRRWVVRLEQEHANLRAALDHFAEHDPARAVRMAADLEWFWVVRGYAAEGLGRLTDLLARVPVDAPDRGRALAAAGQLALQVGDTEDAQPLLEEALSLARRDGDQRLGSHALTHLGWATEALGDVESAGSQHLEAIAMAREAEDGSALGIALNNLAVMNARRGNFEAARPMLEESLDLARRRGHSSVIALTGANLATVAVEAGDLDAAEVLAAEALARAREIGSRPLIAGTLVTQAEISLARDEVDRASARIVAAIDAERPFYDLESGASLLSLAGTLAAIRRQPVRAAMLWAAADRGRERVRLAEAPNIGLLRTKWQPRAHADAPDETSWNAAWTGGRQLSTEDALELATGATTTTGADIDMRSSGRMSMP